LRYLIAVAELVSWRGGLVEDSTFDERLVTTAEEIREARETLVKLGWKSLGAG
jgi:hypothetical protein